MALNTVEICSSVRHPQLKQQLEAPRSVHQHPVGRPELQATSFWPLSNRLPSTVALIGPQSGSLAVGLDSEPGWQVSSQLHTKVPDCQAAALCQPRCPALTGLQLTPVVTAPAAC